MKWTTIEKYIKTNGKVYQLNKCVNNKITYFGTYLTLREARKQKRYFMSKNWDKKYFKGTNVCQYDKMYCIRYNGGRYEIQKWCREEQTICFYGSFSTLTDACDERDCLIRADWDWDTLCDLSIGVY